MTTDDIIRDIAAASEKGDWAQIQSLAGTLLKLVRDDGRGLNSTSAVALVVALAGGAALGARALGGADAGGAFDRLDAALNKTPIDRTDLQTNWGTVYGLLADPTVSIDQNRLKGLMKALKSKRLFEYLAKTGDRAITLFPGDFTMKKLYAQALIDQGQVHAAMTLLEAAVKTLEEKHPHAPETSPDGFEYKEMCGLLGRANKQIYVDNVRSAAASVTARDTYKRYLRTAIEQYGKIYRTGAPGAEHWHGVNLAALLRIAEQDKHAELLTLSPDTYQTIAGDIIAEQLRNVEAKKADQWGLASLAEAYLLTGDVENAGKYVREYLARPGVDQFECTATARQFEEVLRITAADGGKAELLALLKARQIASEDGRFSLNGDSLAQQIKIASSPKYEALHEGLQETMTGKDASFWEVKLLATVLNRAQAIAAIVDENGKTWGTGFLARGRDICDAWDNGVYLITNAHVISCEAWPDEHNPKSPLRPGTARAVLQAAGGSALHLEGPARFLSRPTAFDVAIVRVKGDVDRLSTLEFFPKGTNLTAEDPKNPTTSKPSTVSVIGCPLGGPLSLSVVGSIDGANGVLIDIGGRDANDDDPVFLHYRAPTQPGNSGSPVFETKDWRVVGLHHEGFNEYHGRACLGGRMGMNFGNEGISIQSIRRAVARAQERRGHA